MADSAIVNGGGGGGGGGDGGGSGGADDGGGDGGGRVNITDAHGSEGSRPDRDIVALCIEFLKGHVHILPIVTAIFIIVSLFISYAVSVSYGHVEPDFPYISYTAVETPERCIFAQLINIGACLMGANVYMRFMQQREELVTTSWPPHLRPKIRQLVIASLVCGGFSAFGLSMVANFQTIVMRPPHYVGAGLAFGMGLAYCWLQTSISIRHRRHCGDRGTVTIAQLVISTLLTLFLLIFAVSKTIFKVKEHKGLGTKEEGLRGVYLVSTVSEWLTVVAVVVFALTFCPDFAKLTLQGPKVVPNRAYRDDNAVPLSGVHSHDNCDTSHA